MTEQSANLKTIKIDDVPFETRFKWNDRWYEWHRLTKNFNSLTRIVLPNAPDGKTTMLTGASPAPGTMVEVLDEPDPGYWNDQCQVRDP